MIRRSFAQQVRIQDQFGRVQLTIIEREAEPAGVPSG